MEPRVLAWSRSIIVVALLLRSSAALAQATQPEHAGSSPHAASVDDDVEAGFSAADGAYLRTRDRAWSLRLGLLWQFRASLSSTPDPSRQIELVPVIGRVSLQGTMLAPWIRYFVQTELVGQSSPSPTGAVPPAPRLLDAWLEAQPHEALGARAGILRPPFSRSWMVGLQRQLLFDRSDANLFFRTHGPIAGGSAATPEHATTPVVPWDRDIGVYGFATPFDGMLELYLGVFNGNGFLVGRNSSASVMPMFRAAVSPLGRLPYDDTPAVVSPHRPLRLQLAVGGYYNHPRVDYTSTDPRTAEVTRHAGTEEHFSAQADATIQVESIHVSGELYFRSRRTVDGLRHDELGGTVVAGWMFWAPYLELALRGSWVDPSLGSGLDLRQIYDAALNVYAGGNNLKLQLRYTLSVNDAPGVGGAPGDPLTIARGTAVHTGGLWLQAFF